MPHRTKNKTGAIIIHVGSCDFPIESQDTLDTNYIHYVDLLTTITSHCPKSIILLSRIPPRMGDLSTRVNSRINKFNEKLQKLASSEQNLFFIDNDMVLTNESYCYCYCEPLVQRQLFITYPSECKRQSCLGYKFQNVMKEAFYPERLQKEWEIPLKS